jgi:hypothetical protein
MLSRGDLICVRVAVDRGNRFTPPGLLLPLRRAAVLKGRRQQPAVTLSSWPFVSFMEFFGHLRLIVLSIIALGIVLTDSCAIYFPYHRNSSRQTTHES